MGNTAFPIARFQQAGASTDAINTLQQAWALMSPEAQAAENEWIAQVSDSEILQIASFPSGGAAPVMSGSIVEVDAGALASGSPVTGVTPSSLLAVDASGNLESGPLTQGVTNVSDKAEQLLALLTGPDPAVVSTSTPGAPTTGTWLTDQAIVDSTGVVWVCTAGGTPGTWQEGATGGGGSSTPPSMTDLGSLGATVTLPSPNEGDLQTGTLTQNLVVTLPAAPAAGKTVAFKVKLVQNTTGGFTWGFASSAKFPAGVQIPITTAGAENWMEVVWDGDTSSYAIFPATSGSTVVTCTALDVLGGTGGRLMGFQSTGAAPTQSSPSTNDFWVDTHGTPSFWLWNGSAWENFGGSTGGGGVTITSPNSSVVVGGTSTAPTLEVASSYVDVTSPEGYGRAAYDPTPRLWVSENPRLVDITAHAWVALPVASVPTTAATGGTVAAGTYNVQVTYVTAEGETLSSAAVSVTTTGTTSTITIPSPPAKSGAIGWYAYVANGATYTRQQAPGSPTAIGTALTLTAPPASSGANPPVSDTSGMAGASVSTANADNSTAINAAIKALGMLGMIAYLPAGSYNVQGQINIGDGVTSTGQPATYSGGLVGAALAPMFILNNLGQGEPQVFTQLVWNSTTVEPTLGMVTVNGPVSGWELSNIAIVGNATQSRGPAWGLYIISGQGGRLGGVVTISGTQSGACLTTITGGSSLPANLSGNCSHNHYDTLVVSNVGVASGGPSYGVLVTNTQGSGGGDSCYNNFDTVFLSYAVSGGAKSIGWCFQACDTNRVHWLHVSGSNPTYTQQITYDYTVHNVWPGGNVIYQADLGSGNGVFETGSLATSAAQNDIRWVNTVNGRPPTPTLQNTTWNSDRLSGTATLVAGTKAITCMAAGSLAIRSDSVTQYVRLTLLTAGGTPGTVTATITQNTITLNSTSSTDTSTYFWELVTL